jgi:DNA-binding HxlR family transcriptional regulator
MGHYSGSYSSIHPRARDVPKLRVTALVTTLTARHRRILSGLSNEDLLWEVPGQPYFTQFNERTGKQIRVRVDVLEQMEELGLIRRNRQSQSAHKLDFWEITSQGREALRLYSADRKMASSDHPASDLPRNRKSA